ncbi:GntR family transcriptional regulator, partial [Sphaerochaeta sp.]
MKDLNLKQQAYDYLKTKILNCEIKPGEYICEKDILESAEISRTPFREAVIMLQAEHLVEVRPRHG